MMHREQGMSFFKGLVRGLLGNRPDGATPPPRTDQRETLEASGITVSIGIASPTPQQEAAWKNRREATARYRAGGAGDTSGAVQALEEAQALQGEPQSHDEIRRAKYLQKDGRAAEAWAIYTRLLDQSGAVSLIATCLRSTQLSPSPGSLTP